MSARTNFLTHPGYRESYRDGYKEGHLTALSLVVSLEDCGTLQFANDIISDPDEWRPRRAYWLGFKRALRLHYDDAHRETVLAARRRHLARPKKKEAQ